jgi:hypothetical protein
MKSYGMSEMFLVSCDPPCHAGQFLPERGAKRLFGSAGKLASSNKLRVSQFLLISPESAYMRRLNFNESGHRRADWSETGTGSSRRNLRPQSFHDEGIS